MIPEQTVVVRISRESKHYESLGYPKTKQGDILKVSVKHLPALSKAMIVVICDDCENKRIIQFRGAKNGRYCKRCSGKRTIKIAQQTAPVRKYGPENARWNPNKPAYASYSNRVRGLTKTTYHNHKEEINPLNLVRTRSGVIAGHQLDHIISIKRGFEEGIAPEVLADKLNLRMITWEQNLERRRLDRNINKEQASSKEK